MLRIRWGERNHRMSPHERELPTLCRTLLEKGDAMSGLYTHASLGAMGDQLQPRTPIQGGSVSQLKGGLRQARLGDRPPQHFMARPDVQSLQSVKSGH